MLIENRTTWTADHIRALVEAAVKAVGRKEPITRLTIRRSGYMRCHEYENKLTIRLPQGEAQPLEVLATDRMLSPTTYRRLLLELVSDLTETPTGLEWEEGKKIKCLTIRAALGLSTDQTTFHDYRYLADNERDNFAIPEWANLPLMPRKRSGLTVGERVETLRAQLLDKENARQQLIEDHARFLSQHDREIAVAREKLAEAEAKLNKPKRRSKKADAPLALIG